MKPADHAAATSSLSPTAIASHWSAKSIEAGELVKPAPECGNCDEPAAPPSDLCPSCARVEAENAAAEAEEEDADDTCGTCAGSGIGQHGDTDTSTCGTCGGSGGESMVQRRRDEREARFERAEDERRGK